MFYFTAVCNPICENSGTCTDPDVCDCTAEWTGDTCETRNDLIYYEKWGNSEPIHGIFVMNAIYIDPVFSFTRHSHHVCNVVLSKKSSLLVGG